jgi:hypothetical protein
MSISMISDSEYIQDTPFEKMSKPFVKIVDGKLSFVADDFSPERLQNTKVISILGKARMGKSTFLNTLISRITGQNSVVFKTTDTLEHCTRGIDYYYIESHNLLLLDSQGIGHQDSSHDPALLLLVYLISDIIIFNERMMLQNEALKLLEPVCAFMTYIDLDESVSKPHLFFRISDGDMIKSEQENLELVLRHYEDQYESIRESIRNLFNSDIQLLKTDSLDRKCKKMLSEDNYLSLLIEGEIGFQEAIDCILGKLKSISLFRNYIKRISSVIEQINGNQKININKLDVVGMTAREEIRDWIDTIDKSVYIPIEVDGTQACYEDKVEKRKNIKKALLTSFTKKFKLLPETIRKPHYERLENNLNEPIQKATCESRKKAELLVKRLVDAAQRNRVFPSITSRGNSFTNLQDSFFESYLADLHNLNNGIDLIYKPVKEEYSKWLCGIFETFNIEVNKIKAEEAIEKKTFEVYCQNELDGFEETVKTALASVEDNLDFVKQTDEVILGKYVNNILTEAMGELCKMLHKRELLVSMVNCKLDTGSIIIKESFTNMEAIGYDSVKTIYDDFKNTLLSYIRDPQHSTTKMVIEKKNAVLYGELLDENQYTSQIISKNNNIMFVFDELLNSSVLLIDSHKSSRPVYMTLETYEKKYKPLITAVIADLVEKRYMDEDYGNTLFNTYIEANRRVVKCIKSDTPYMKNILDIFSHKLKKLYCKEFRC